MRRQQALAGLSIAVLSTASNRAAAVQTRSRSGLLIASLRQRTSVSTPMPTSRETSSNAALSGGSNRATALSLNACPYRANVYSRRPLLVETGSRNPGRTPARYQAVDLWTMRFAHRPACRGQRVALTTAPTFDHKPHRLLPLSESLNPQTKI
jgi:hypothetical protein